MITAFGLMLSVSLIFFLHMIPLSSMGLRSLKLLFLRSYSLLISKLQVRKSTILKPQFLSAKVLEVIEEAVLLVVYILGRFYLMTSTWICQWLLVDQSRDHSRLLLFASSLDCLTRWIGSFLGQGENC